MAGPEHRAEDVALLRTRDDHCTPPWVLTVVRGFHPQRMIDPCSNPWVNALGKMAVRVMLPEYRTPEIEADVLPTESIVWGDGLRFDWGEVAGLAHVNPPYSRGQIEPWAQRCWDQHLDWPHLHVLLLVPADPSTKWARFCLRSASAVLFWGKRLAFDGAGGLGAKQPSATYYWGPDPDRFRSHFENYGVTLRLRA